MCEDVSVSASRNVKAQTLSPVVASCVALVVSCVSAAFHVDSRVRVIIVMVPMATWYRRCVASVGPNTQHTLLNKNTYDKNMLVQCSVLLQLVLCGAGDNCLIRSLVVGVSWMCVDRALD